MRLVTDYTIEVDGLSYPARIISGGRVEFLDTDEYAAPYVSEIAHAIDSGILSGNVGSVAWRAVNDGSRNAEPWELPIR